jgi:hypothetical protein
MTGDAVIREKRIRLPLYRLFPTFQHAICVARSPVLFLRPGLAAIR